MTRPEQKWLEWTPPWVGPHVKAKYTPREADEQGQPEPQTILMECTYIAPDGKPCGGRWKTMCSTGSVRVHITRFSSAHFHRDPFKP
jgi:hypothetical protein